ncbi:MAG: hypothetical protein H0U73_03650 [Tatlockia sp.]|nr:hypothetical protein [Tatlockia sp.]
MFSGNKFEKYNFFSEGPQNEQEIKELIIENLNTNYDLNNQEMIIRNFRDIKSGNYGIKLLAGEQNLSNIDFPTNELNIFFMGTGGALHFGGKHKDVYEGGDVLCHLGLHKGIEQKQPTLLLRGVGTANFVSTTHYFNEVFDKNPHTSTGGAINEALLGSKTNTRLSIAMEQFFIPTLLQMITKVLKNNKSSAEFTFNIVGHSRGAICSYAMCDLIEKWMEDSANNTTYYSFRNYNHAKIIAKDYKLAIESRKPDGSIHTDIQNELSFDDIKKALDALKSGKIKYKTKLMIYDPVEGKFAFGDYYKTKFTFPIFGTDYTCDYAGIPPSVKEAQIFLAVDERRNDFQPTLAEVEDEKSTSLMLIPVMGVHGTLKGYLSVFNDIGQYSYFTAKDTFLKEALRASVDLVKVKSTRFLFDILPPFDLITFYNLLYSNKGEGYISTKTHFFEKINQLCEERDKDFIDFLQSDLKIRPENLNDKLIHKQLINLCKWIMLKDPKFSSQLYFELEKDINTIFMHPKDELNAKKLNLLRKEMRLDKMQLLLSKNMVNQDMRESRYLNMRHKETLKFEKTMLNRHYSHLSYNPTSTIWYPKSAEISQKAENYFEDTFYFNLFDTFQSSELEVFKPEEIKALKLVSYNFAALHEKGILFMSNKKNTAVEEAYREAREIFYEHLYDIKLELSETLKIKISSVLMMKEIYQYQIYVDQKNNPHYLKLSEAKIEYHLKSAFKLLESKQHNKNPQLYFEIYNLILKLERSEHIDSYRSLCEILKTFLKSPGTDIVKAHLIKELWSWHHVLINFKNDLTEELNQEIRYNKTLSKGVAPNTPTEHLLYMIAEIPKLIEGFKGLEKLRDQCTQLSGSGLGIKSLKDIESSMNQLILEKIEQLENEERKDPFLRIKRDLKLKLHDHFKALYIEKMKLTLVKESIVSRPPNANSIINPERKDYFYNNLINQPTSYYFFSKSNIWESEIVKSFLTAVQESNVVDMKAYLEAAKQLIGITTKWYVFTSKVLDDQGNTPLHLMATAENPALWEVVQNCAYQTTLSSYKIGDIFDFTIMNKDGLTPLTAAVKAGKVNIVKKMEHIYKIIDKNYDETTYKGYIYEAKLNNYEKEKEKNSLIILDIHDEKQEDNYTFSQFQK